MQLRNFNIHYDPYNLLDNRFYEPSLQNYTLQDFAINKLTPFFIALKKVRDLVIFDHHLRFLLNRSQSSSQHRSLIIRIFDIHQKMLSNEFDCEHEQTKVEEQFVFDIYTNFPCIPPPKHLISHLPSRPN